MGLTYFTVDSLAREAIHLPLVGAEVLLIGRQTVHVERADFDRVIKSHGMSALASGGAAVGDYEAFQKFGASHVRAIDHSDYEGADIIHDFNVPLPADLFAIADFIYDGSTLDNVFDPVAALRSMVDMLRPGGRLLMVNSYSLHHEPYALLPPLWFLDYFVVNGFLDCKVYIRVHTKPLNVFTINIDSLLDPVQKVSAFQAPHEMSILVLAEKGAQSTSHIRPIQQHYRSQQQWVHYRTNLARIKESPRPHMARSEDGITVFDVKSGHLFMDRDFHAKDPLTEIFRQHPGFQRQ